MDATEVLLGYRMTEACLSMEQGAVFQEIRRWYDGCKRGKVTTLTMGGFAGCLSGSTVLEYNRGIRTGVRSIEMADLYLKFNGMRGSGRGAAQKWIDLMLPTYLHSVWPDGTVGRNRVIAVLQSGVKPVLKAEFDNGSCLVLTEDHPVAVAPHEFAAVGTLRVGDTVLARGSMKARKGDGRRLDLRPPRVLINVKYHPYGAFKAVECNGVTYEYTRIARARLVVEACMNNVSYEELVHALKYNSEASAAFRFLPSDVDVHHEDENPLNDDISNLVVLAHAAHAREHAKEENLDLEYTREAKLVKLVQAGKEMTFDIQMEPPANNFVASGIFVHNTGKTRLITVLATEFDDYRIAFCAFTGKAASILRRNFRAAGVSANTQTLHGLIRYPIVDKETGKIKGWGRRESVDASLIVVDEASMVDEAMYNDLASYDIPILAVGDHGQLPPVMGTFNLMDNPTLRLEKIHRQAESSPIIALSAAIRQHGALPHIANTPEVQVVRLAHQQVVLDSLFSMPDLKVENTCIVCFTNATRVFFNDAVRKVRWGKDYDVRPKVGDVVINLRNTEGLIFNGMRGVITRIDAETKLHYYMTILFEHEEIEVSGPVSRTQFNRPSTYGEFAHFEQDCDLPAGSIRRWDQIGLLFDFGYALTVYKAQGSQFENVIVSTTSLPNGMSAERKKRALYTAVTRASKYLTVLVK